MATLGADPEFFIQNGDGHLINPAKLQIPGTKKRPHAIDRDGITIQRDGMAVEYGLDPCTSPQEFVSKIQLATKRVDQYLSALDAINCKFKYRPKLVYSPSATFKKAEFDDLGMEVGCDPDRCAYSDSINLPPDIKKWRNNRFAGGHIHLGYTPAFEIPKNIVVQFFDLLVGLYAMELFGRDRRTTEMGQAGRYREKPYGVEYRTLSNAWACNDYGAATYIADRAFSLGTALEDPSKEAILIRTHNTVDWEAVQSQVSGIARITPEVTRAASTLLDKLRTTS